MAIETIEQVREAREYYRKELGDFLKITKIDSAILNSPASNAIPPLACGQAMVETLEFLARQRYYFGNKTLCTYSRKSGVEVCVRSELIGDTLKMTMMSKRDNDERSSGESKILLSRSPTIADFCFSRAVTTPKIVEPKLPKLKNSRLAKHFPKYSKKLQRYGDIDRVQYVFSATMSQQLACIIALQLVRGMSLDHPPLGGFGERIEHKIEIQNIPSADRDITIAMFIHERRLWVVVLFDDEYADWYAQATRPPGK